jgi:hypothetical protein
MTTDDTPLDALIHDVKSRCAVVIDAAERLRLVPPAERREIISLMLERAERVVALLKESEAEKNIG